MKKNVGSLDKNLRMIAGVVLAALYLTNVVSGTIGVTFLIVGVIFFATGFINLCPLYSILKISTITQPENKEN